MRAIILSLATVGALSFALPVATPASAEGITVQFGDRGHVRDHDRGWRRHHNDWRWEHRRRRHRDHDHD